MTTTMVEQLKVYRDVFVSHAATSSSIHYSFLYSSQSSVLHNGQLGLLFPRRESEAAKV